MRIDDIAGQFGIAFGLPFSRVPFHPEVLALDVAKATWLLEKSAVTRWTAHAYFADFGRRENDSDPLHLRRLLRSGREWPRSRSTKCRDEIAPPHLTRLKKVSYALSKLPQPRTFSEGQMASASSDAGRVRCLLRGPFSDITQHPRQVRSRGKSGLRGELAITSSGCTTSGGMTGKPDDVYGRAPPPHGTGISVRRMG